ncbi:bifunctional 4-hydroxy-2-oxoglutarate aldolase/2-dehydro-3-deoxy-phosphogluconate aldolase [Desulfofundulus sp. TPOSR]|uniref:2-dehydro-3-deoxyphosphogluconate aldolase/4-hydroxy-2-oxoglutarate aldolase n=1 Tax=Desulfofundulus kuznetsovii (strain DSM 6115 / VKM B-1805 / 17) TaxID=760568 RepID=A0AAU8P9N9_DESK7|nr:bifunctional 2-keto-4-hydroxyglutarate aldolase/2-keto-3-deoxy-6-phosphogluconate aldolase [Desulfofundulus sp. TPOSR]AEG15209.1 2-dehydro-3-deoxyphosphogluconate aldolase/4-hydroxy-2-oxoglutarate aldolase [Desulfofundulus kuznetsovii DSM 6115]NHM28346.1 bifunctional 4-hydroxy-2-oxoglutarate aldolase/2-dehydro-3-deoxy-phosphogluconate aldolase [Desulfofundulus sp. TPOSR]
MLKKYVHLKQILDCGIVAVVRAETPGQALKVAEAVRKGGITAIEITMTVPGAIDVIRELVSNFRPEEMLVGAGTVLDAETARLAMLAGAEFIVGPNLNPEVVRISNRYQKICMPGAMSVTEVVQAMELGADVVKIFPGSIFGPEIIKAIRGPLPQVPLMPTGGVSLDNVDRWIKAGAVAVGVGSEITKKGLQNNDYDLITETARAFVEKIRAARQQ